MNFINEIIEILKNISIEKIIDMIYKEGIKTTWDNRKTILFEDQEGHKVRNSRLEEIFKTGLDKETLENEFRTTKYYKRKCKELENKIEELMK